MGKKNKKQNSSPVFADSEIFHSVIFGISVQKVTFEQIPWFILFPTYKPVLLGEACLN